MKSTLIIPKRIKVGFNERNDTYTGKLGYIIYHDGKTWRKEASWESWREKYISDEEYQTKKKIEFDQRIKSYTDAYNEGKKDKNKSSYQYSYYSNYSTLEECLKAFKVDSIDNYPFYLRGFVNDSTIEPVEFDNVPTEGFVLNKKAGGTKGHSWEQRSTYCRVYDPRGFEFEITIPNLLYILENSTSTKGKGLSGNFVYSWDGKDLVLVPEEAPEYQEMVNFTQLQDLKVSTKDLVSGGVYLHKDGQEKTYMGQSEIYDNNGVPCGKKHWWYFNYSSYSTRHERFEPLETSNVKKFVRMNDDFAELMQKLSEQSNYKKKDIEYVEITEQELSNKLDIYTKTYYYGSQRNIYSLNVYILEGKKYKPVHITHYETGNFKKEDYTIEIGRTTEDFSSIKQLLNKYKLWQVRTTTKLS